MRFVALALLVSPVMGAVLHRRQISPSDIPSQCQATCAGALALQSSCASLSCLCTSSSEESIQTCANCAIPLNPSLEPTLKPYLDDFNLLCSGLPPLTFPPIPTSTSTDSSTAPTDTDTDTGTTVTTTTTSDTPSPSSSDTSDTTATTDDNATPTATGTTPAATCK